MGAGKVLGLELGLAEGHTEGKVLELGLAE
jgi:hypothetical protein